MYLKVDLCVVRGTQLENAWMHFANTEFSIPRIFPPNIQESLLNIFEAEQVVKITVTNILWIV